MTAGPATTTTTDDQSAVLALLGEARATMVESMADGPRTVAELAELLDVSQVAVRRHLARLVDDGWAAGRTDEPDGPGRPVTRYHLTAQGHDLLPQGYATLAAELLTWIRDTAGPNGVAQWLEWRAARRARRLAAHVESDDLDERLHQLAEALTASGSRASVTATEDGWVLRQHHCTVLDVARDHPELCHAEAAEFARVLGDRVTIERRASRAGGAGVCECAVATSTVDQPPEARALPVLDPQPAAPPASPTSHPRTSMLEHS